MQRESSDPEEDLCFVILYIMPRLGDTASFVVMGGIGIATLYTVLMTSAAKKHQQGMDPASPSFEDRMKVFDGRSSK